MAAERRGPVPGATPHDDTSPLVLSGPDSTATRRDLLRRAEVFAGPVHPRPASALDERLAAYRDSVPACHFIADAPSGTSAKFDCVLADGGVIKVKYGRNPEIHAEVAATRLLTALGFAADDVAIVPRIRCYGCPRYPFLTMQLLWLSGAMHLLAPNGYAGGYTDFENVSVERKFPAPAVETEVQSGWAWWELEGRGSDDAAMDALRLMAIFLAHWDNKAENQRIVCVDGVEPQRGCARPLLMLQDVGATFGPSKVNLARWRQLPIWTDPDTCAVSMRSMPWDGATFPDRHISESGRQELARRLAGLSEADVRSIFATARFPQFHSATADERDLDAWTAAFRHRVDEIANAGPCL